MAKLALINKQKKREKMVAKYAKKREAIKAKMSRNGSKTRLHNRCSITGRARGFFRMFGLCRQQVRTQASEGKLPGVRKSSW